MGVYKVLDFGWDDGKCLFSPTLLSTEIRKLQLTILFNYVTSMVHPRRFEGALRG